MMPVIIGIGGGHSGAGKTLVACRILERLKGWGAIKYTNTPLYSSITDDIKVLSEEGKDTKRFLDSGAEKVLWVQAASSESEKTLQMAADMLSHLQGIVVEGNSAIEVLKPDIVIFVSGDAAKFKKSADRILQIADILLFDSRLPASVPEQTVVFSRNDIDLCVNFVQGIIEKKCNQPKLS
ncbi:MAG: molybdopterin-guanine dinucleotide biosynthesis protein B [Nitrospira sp.]|nr:molybdopterin-guanine dinucleotide biosynthesis protein B [Nitrospira sp.]